MIVFTASSERSKGESLASETTASKYLSQLQGREEEDLAQTSKKSVRRQARNVSVKGLTTQQMRSKAFRVFTAGNCTQPSYVTSAHGQYL